MKKEKPKTDLLCGSDFELRGFIDFIPLLPAQTILDFSGIILLEVMLIRNEKLGSKGF